MTFAHPYLLLLLLLLPVMAWLKGKRGEPPSFLYSSAQLVRGLVNVTRYRAGGFLAALRWLALALFIVALAQPRLTKSETKITASGVDIVVAFDLSGSMEVPDFVVQNQRVNRFEIARAVLKQFVDGRPNDRIGLVAFAVDAFVVSPPTLDHEFLVRNLDRLQLGMVPWQRTAIGSAISTAVNRLRDVKAKSKIVILMTDGQNNSGKIDPLVAAEAAQALGVKIYTIGVGNQDPRRSRDGDVIDAEMMQKVAQMTGGRFYLADNARKFQDIYAEIDKLEKTEAEVKKYARHRELFGWLVATGLLLVLTEIALGHTVWRRLP